MDLRRPTAVLEDEHRVIEKVLKAMALMADRVESGQEIEEDAVTGMVEFMRMYADRCHHGKEETHMFPFLVEKGVPSGGCPLGALTHEHTKGRTLVGQLLERADRFRQEGDAARPQLAETLRALVDLYPGHIWKEDYLLFSMTDKLLSQADQEELARRFESVDEEMGRDEIRRLEKSAERLSRLYELA